MTAVVAQTGPDVGVPWHYGDPMREQRLLDAGDGVVDLSHRGVITVTGPDRLSWLHSLTTQHLEGLEPGRGVTTLVLSPHGHIEYVLYGVDDGETFWAHTEPSTAAALVGWLDGMRFLMRVEVSDKTSEYAVVWFAGQPAGEHLVRSGPDSLDGRELFVRRDGLEDTMNLGPRAGTWALEARRIAAGVPRIGLDTDHRTIPNEIGLLGAAVHLDKGCYRGQETVARVHNLGRPPRRLVRLHLDGSVDALPTPGAELELDGRAVGFVGGSARHFELGPIALGLIKRGTPLDAQLSVEGIAAAQEPLVDPEIGLHVRPSL
ncbi:MAG TPA: folate-binding protein [Propionibacteriaceae bacterium]|nr:folate-binding protein [Propionibacteriaceae bacterium]